MAWPSRSSSAFWCPPCLRWWSYRSCITRCTGAVWSRAKTRPCQVRKPHPPGDNTMAHIVIVGAGIGGMPAAYEIRELLGKEHKITVVNNTDYFQFVPSNPWIAVGWRQREDITLPIAPYLTRKGIGFIPKGVETIDAAANQLTLVGGETLAYDYLVITTGPKLSFSEVPGAGPASHGGGGFTHSVCSVDHAQAFFADYENFLKNPGPVIIGAMPGASCFGPAYEFAFILDTDLRRRKLRHLVPITYVSSEPYIGHLGLGGVGDRSEE